MRIASYKNGIQVFVLICIIYTYIPDLNLSQGYMIFSDSNHLST